MLIAGQICNWNGAFKWIKFTRENNHYYDMTYMLNNTNK